MEVVRHEEEEPCPARQAGHQCVLEEGHAGAHDFGLLPAREVVPPASEAVGEPEPVRVRAPAAEGADVPEGAVWVAYYSDRSGLAIFLDELSCLRYAVGTAAQVAWITLPCDDVWAAVGA